MLKSTISAEDTHIIFARVQGTVETLRDTVFMECVGDEESLRTVALAHMVRRVNTLDLTHSNQVPSAAGCLRL